MSWGIGLIKLGKYIGNFFLWIFNFFSLYKKFLPAGMVGIFLINDFFVVGFTIGWTQALISLSQKILVAEKTINYHVNLAIQNSSEYTLYSVFAIFVSCYMLWILFKFLKRNCEKLTGSHINYGSGVIAILIIALLEIGVMNITSGEWFFPIKDGVWFLLINIEHVLLNINYTFIKTDSDFSSLKTNISIENNVTVEM
jgi:hypothetical protein